MQLEGQEEGVPRVSEYCSRAYFVPHRLPARGSLEFVPQFAGNFFSELPLTIERDVLPPMRALLEEMRGREKFDAIVCDFLSAAVNLRDFSDVVLFQHNVETVIWERMSTHGVTALHRRYFAGQARKMRAFEERVCKACRHVIAVSEADARRMREMFGIDHVTEIPTGVDVDYFAKPEKVEAVADLVFTGSMDWLPNVDGVTWFANEILPRVRSRLPECTVAVVGRNAGREILELAERDSRIRVTGTVPDIRPYLWGAKAAIVPLRIGGGTRLKIYEAMAASTPQVSTTIGAEGLEYRDGRDIHIADRPEEFAEQCVALIESAEKRRKTAESACEMVTERFGWRQVSMHFERVLEQARR
jgi:glycosyltransferase involved in cell wall biosynthesis